MPAPLPKELRDRFARLIAEGLSGRAASRRLQVSAAPGARWKRQIHTSGAATAASIGRPPGNGKLAPHVEFFREVVAQDPDMTLFELRDALADAKGITVHHSTIAGLLKRLGFTHKKIAPSRQICSANRLPVNGMATEDRHAKVRRQRDD